MSNSEKALSIIHDNYPGLQDELLSYVEAILIENADTFESVEELKESIAYILLDVDSSKGDTEVDQICQDIFKLLVDTEKSKNYAPILLDAPVCISDLLEKNKSESMSYRTIANDYGKNKVDVDAANANFAKAQEAKLRKKKKVKEEIPTLHVSQQFNKNTVYDNTENSSLSNFTVDNFDLSFGSKVLLQEATISIAVGRRYGFVGRNGLGKSTLLKAISTGELKMPTKISILLVEQEVRSDNTKAVESVLEADLVRKSLLNELEELTKSKTNDKSASDRLLVLYHELELIEADKAPARASKILKGLGFSSEMQEMTTNQFSGGWRMRLSLARALFSQPDLLLLDEPTNMLDMKATIWLEEYLKTWKKSLIVVSHDQKFLDSACTDTLFIHNKKIEHYKCNFSQFELARANKFASQAREYESQKEYRDKVQRFIDRFRTYASKASAVQSKIKMLDKMTVIEAPEVEKKVQFEFPATVKLSSPVVQLCEMSFGYDTSRTIIRNLDISVNSLSRVCVVGENGAGKTTLLNLLMDKLKPQLGEIRRHKNLRIGYFSQHHVDQLNLDQSSLEFLQNKFPGFEPEAYRNMLGKFGITGEIALRNINSLSGGQKSRVAFTVLSMTTPNFLILDEPTNHLDMQTIAALGEAINKFQGGVILVSHDERLINNVCEELWLVERSGRVSIVDGGISRYREMIIKEMESDQA